MEGVSHPIDDNKNQKYEMRGALETYHQTEIQLSEEMLKNIETQR